MLTVYGDRFSGNCYKVAWVLHRLAIEHRWVEVDILAGDTHTREFLALNPLGKVPLLVLDDGRALSESNAIIYYLAAGSALLPNEPFAAAKLLAWQFFEQYSHEPYIATARFINRYLGLPENRREEYAAKQIGGHKALAVMEQQLASSRFLLGDQLSLADITLYAYTHVAEEGGFELAGYPHVGRWLADFGAQPGHLAMGD